MSTDEFDLTITQGSSVPGRRKNNLAGTVAPVVTDDADSGYEILSVWADVTADAAYICVDSSAGAAVWLNISSSGVSDHGSLTGLTNSGDDHPHYSSHIVMGSGITDPPEPVWNTDGDDYIYESIV